MYTKKIERILIVELKVLILKLKVLAVVVHLIYSHNETTLI